MCKGPEVQLSFLGVLWALHKGRKRCRYLQWKTGGWGGNRHKKNPKQLIQQGETTNNLCSEISYHPSKAQPRICLRTGAGAWPRCHSGGPCSSSATHLPCSPPAEQPRAQAQRKTSFKSLFTSIKLQRCFPLSVNAQNHKFTKVGENLQAQSPTLPVLTKPGCSQFACWAPSAQFKVPQKFVMLLQD